MTDFNFYDMDAWGGGHKKTDFLTFENIVLIQITRCIKNGSVEWHGGYWIEKSRPDGFVEKSYVQNSREVFCNSVAMLKALIYGYFDKKMNEADKIFRENMKNLELKYKEEINKGVSPSKAKANFSERKIEYYIHYLEELILLVKRNNFFKEVVSEEYL